MNTTPSSVCPKDMTFLRKLYRILSHENTATIAWSVCGSRFAIKDTATMESHVLPHFFRASEITYAGFRKQLIAHGFVPEGEETFHHCIYTRRFSVAALTKRSRRPVKKSTPVQAMTTHTDMIAASDDVWHMLAAVCLHSTVDATPTLPRSMLSSNPLFRTTSTVDHHSSNWSALATPALVCL
ncbi:Aste57867_9371 [Aphanomyces stellatus]|uniref:Aste57867_9371 protein n=1 Tax=Aphanomyces stellatus TaxID=120398 RepID=A0A485KMV7_9STRA|nr:hypothetical protein As57867_009335 [Aphanomyces stellatus]VFT86252.1 Aste57867_9371 [Aphanomyces stellatus]